MELYGTISQFVLFSRSAKRSPSRVPTAHGEAAVVDANEEGADTTAHLKLPGGNPTNQGAEEEGAASAAHFKLLGGNPINQGAEEDGAATAAHLKPLGGNTSAWPASPNSSATWTSHNHHPGGSRWCHRPLRCLLGSRGQSL